MTRAEQTRQHLSAYDPFTVIRYGELNELLRHARRLIDQIDRRVLRGKRTPHDEKVFSLFQPHTEWISKGKAGGPVELKLRLDCAVLPKKVRLLQADQERESCQVLVIRM